jgi:trehalose 6-phosphate synthase
VNPYDIEGTANAIHLALQMPVEERRVRHQAQMAVIKEYDVHWWCRSFLDTLSKAEAEETGTPWLRL